MLPTVLPNMTANITQITLSNLSLVEAVNFLQPMAIFIGAILVYSIFIFQFYNFMSKKEIFKFELAQTGKWLRLKRGFGVLMYIIKHIVIFPIVVSFCFIVLVIFFAFLSKNQSVENILLVAMTLVATVRILSYYNEELSRELAKMIPIGLLGVFLVDMSYFSLESSIRTILSVPAYSHTVIYYISFVVLIEILLRCLSLIPLGKKAKQKTNFL